MSYSRGSSPPARGFYSRDGDPRGPSFRGNDPLSDPRDSGLALLGSGGLFRKCSTRLPFEGSICKNRACRTWDSAEFKPIMWNILVKERQAHRYEEKLPDEFYREEILRWIGIEAAYGRRCWHCNIARIEKGGEPCRNPDCGRYCAEPAITALLGEFRAAYDHAPEAAWFRREYERRKEDNYQPQRPRSQVLSRMASGLHAP